MSAQASDAKYEEATSPTSPTDTKFIVSAAKLDEESAIQDEEGDKLSPVLGPIRDRTISQPRRLSMNEPLPSNINQQSGKYDQSFRPLPPAESGRRMSESTVQTDVGSRLFMMRRFD